MLKSKIDTLLPLALALLLPGLAFLTNRKAQFPEIIGLIGTWLIASFILYLLWFVLLYLWDIQTGRNKWRFAGAAIGFLVIWICAIFFLNIKMENSIRMIVPVIVFLPIQYAMRIQRNNARLRLEKEQILTENYRAQLKALQSKIDPHFLFNSLNTLQSMVRHQHPNSERFIISLSDFYRHTLMHNEDTTLPLSDELSVLRSYLFLMERRNEGAVQISWQIDPALQSFHLPTLSLQVAVENCFKHNSISAKMPLQIEIYSSDDHYITVNNNIQSKIGQIDASGYGLDLLKKRYELMGIQKGLVIEKTPQQFSVKLKLI